MFKPQTKQLCKLSNRVTDWRRFNHEIRQLSEQINRYHHAYSVHTLKSTSLHSPRYC